MRGSKPGERRGGRQRGTKNRRTLERERALAEASDKIANVLGDNAFDGDSLALMQAIYRDVTQPTPLRLDAAKSAIPFERPRLSSIDAKMTGSVSLAELVNVSYRNDLPEV
jgi:hypothetical protein